jgi:hypothetical protein
MFYCVDEILLQAKGTLVERARRTHSSALSVLLPTHQGLH